MAWRAAPETKIFQINSKDRDASPSRLPRLVITHIYRKGSSNESDWGRCAGDQNPV